MTRLLVSVVVPTFNRASVLARCLAALGDQSVAREHYEVIVVDDGSTDATANVVARAAAGSGPVARYVYQANAGPAAARNRGLGLARGDVVLFLGDDTIAERHLIEAHRAAQSRDGGPWAVVGRIEPEHADRLTPFERFLAGSGLQFDYRPVQRDPENLPFSMYYTANVSSPRAALGAAGGFDERFRDACWEDVELGYRLQRAGVRFRYAPQAGVRHAHAVSLPEYLRRMEKAGRAARLLLAMHPRPEVQTLLEPLLMSQLGFRIAPARARLAHALAGVAEATGLAQRCPRLIGSWYSTALHYAFNRAFHDAGAALQVRAE